MDLMMHLQPLGPADLAAVVFILLAYNVIDQVIEHPPARFPSVSVIMEQYRHDWMREMAGRPQRIFDASIIASLRQGTSFFASASMIAIGGAVAMVGDPTKLQSVASALSIDAQVFLIRIKVLLVVVFLANALLKFIWAHRLFGYCAILMASVPNEVTAPGALDRAAQAADVNISAARGFNRGLRSIYFALASLAWLLGPAALAVAVVITLGVLIRRDFASGSRRSMMQPGASGHRDGG